MKDYLLTYYICSHWTDAFSGLLMRQKCICGQGSAPNPAVGANGAPPPNLSWWERGLAASPQTLPPPSAFSLEFLSFGPQGCTPKTNARLRRRTSNRKSLTAVCAGVGWVSLQILI